MAAIRGFSARISSHIAHCRITANDRTDYQPNKSGREGARQTANVISHLKRMQVISLLTAITNRSAPLVRPGSADLGADFIGELGEP